MPVDHPAVGDWPTIRDRHLLLENEAILALNKPPGISVTGERHDTDLVRLAEDAGERLMPAHRIDKVTSGAVLFARSVEVHGGLTRQFNQRTVDKAYLVVTRSRGLPERGTIDLPLSVGRKNRVRVAAPRESIVFNRATDRWSVPQSQVFEGKRTYPSLTAFARLWEGEDHSVLVARPLTGRRHQLRVHLAWVGHPIAGDPLFAEGAKGTEGTAGERTLLHSWHLVFDATWSGGTRLQVEAPPDPGFWAATPDLDPETILDGAARSVSAAFPPSPAER